MSASAFLIDPRFAQFAEKVLQDDNPTLRKVSQPVIEFGTDLTNLADRMILTMRVHNGRGLAAIQIGIPTRLIVALADDKLYVMANPVITRRLNREAIEREGCLSVPPRKWRRVSRPAKCEIEWQDTMGNRFSDGFSGESARVLQHEIDHLDGVLIIDKKAVA